METETGKEGVGGVSDRVVTVSAVAVLLLWWWWCRTVMRTVYKVITRTAYRRRPVCCQGYVEVDGTTCERE